MDEVEETLRRAGRQPLIDDARVRRELGELAAARSRLAAPPRGRLALPVLIGSGALLLGGAGAVAATQFGPWTVVTDPDYVVARDWRDAAGDYLGSCESHVRVEHDDPAARSAALEILGSIDVAELAPDPEYVAGALFALGRPEGYARLLGGDEPDWSTFGGSWEGIPDPARALQSDARILQVGLLQTVHREIAAQLQAAELDPGFRLTGEGETQCTTDPGR